MQPSQFPEELKVFLRNAVKTAKTISVSVYLTVLTAEIIFQIALNIRGGGTSDAGIRTYQYSGLALLFWVTAFPTLSFVLAVLLKNTIDRSSNLSYLVVGAITIQFLLLRLLELFF
jgi:hypothetical protein